MDENYWSKIIGQKLLVEIIGRKYLVENNCEERKKNRWEFILFKINTRNTSSKMSNEPNLRKNEKEDTKPTPVKGRLEWSGIGRNFRAGSSSSAQDIKDNVSIPFV